MSAATDLLEAGALALATARRTDSPAAAFLAEELLEAGLCVLARVEHAESAQSLAPFECGDSVTLLESLRTGAEGASVRVEPELHTPN